MQLLLSEDEGGLARRAAVALVHEQRCAREKFYCVISIFAFPDESPCSRGTLPVLPVLPVPPCRPLPWLGGRAPRVAFGARVFLIIL